MLQSRSPVTYARACRGTLRAAACLGFVAAATLGATGGSAAAPVTPQAEAKGKAAPAPVAATPVPDWPIGSPRARVTLIEYGSLTCGHCAEFNNQVLPSLKTSYVDTGRVRYVFRAFPTPPMGLSYPLHVLARCAGSDRYHQVVDAFFQQQRDIILASRDPKGAKDAVYKIFTQASGMTGAQADVCLRTQSYAETINRQAVQGEEMGVESTPSLFIQTPKGTTRLEPPYDQSSLARALDQALAESPPTPAAALPRAKAKAKAVSKAKKP